MVFAPPCTTLHHKDHRNHLEAEKMPGGGSLKLTDAVPRGGIATTMAFDFFVTEFREVWDQTEIRRVVSLFLEDETFHYFRHLSDMVVVMRTFDEVNYEIVAWAILSRQNNETVLIEMIDTFVRGEGWAEILIREWLDEHPDKNLEPHNIIPSAQAYWQKLKEKNIPRLLVP